MTESPNIWNRQDDRSAFVTKTSSAMAPRILRSTADTAITNYVRSMASPGLTSGVEVFGLVRLMIGVW